MTVQTKFLHQVLDQFMKRAYVTPDQLSRQTSISKDTILNWRKGRVKKPRDWRDLVKIAAALHLNVIEANELLQAGDHPTVSELMVRVKTNEDKQLLVQWTGVKRGNCYNIPSIPHHFLPRDLALAAVRAKVLTPSAEPVAITGLTRAIGIQGMGGIGKSMLAAALAQDAAIRDAFPDGIYWLTLGQSPNVEVKQRQHVVVKQRQLIYALKGTQPKIDDPDEGRTYLHEALSGKTCLIILDDVWKLEDVEKFSLPESGQNRLLITTRDAGLVQAMGADEYKLNVLNDDDSLTLLAQAASVSRKDMNQNPIVTSIAHKCGNLPLALAMVGMMVRGRDDGWTHVLKRLQQKDLRKIRQQFPHYPYPDMFRAIAVSVDALAEDEGLADYNPIQRYLDLAVFPKATPISQAVLEIYWRTLSLNELDVDDLVLAFVNRALLQRDDEGRLTLHDLQWDYVRQQVGDLSAKHQHLVDSYKESLSKNPITSSAENYFSEYIIHHLHEAGHLRRESFLLLQQFAEVFLHNPLSQIAHGTVIKRMEKIERCLNALSKEVQNYSYSGRALQPLVEADALCVSLGARYQENLRLSADFYHDLLRLGKLLQLIVFRYHSK